ncbi:MAG: ribonuclease-3 [Paracoccaceae bacterium]|jgi:ribonuclease-3
MARRALDSIAASLGERLGVPIVASDRLEEALTHASASSPARPPNERLEFLGDRVLGLVIADALIARFPRAAEGELAPRLNQLVRKETCAQMATELGLGDMMRLGRSEHVTGGRRKNAVLGDGMEALIAAIYLDRGLDGARTAVLALWAPLIDAAGPAPQDAKTALQEWAQARGAPPPVYDVLDRAGPDHSPVFTVIARLATGEVAEGKAASKRAAQQAAAGALLARLSPDHAAAAAPPNSAKAGGAAQSRPAPSDGAEDKT